MTHVLFIVGWSLTVDTVSTPNKRVYISSAQRDDGAPVIFSQRAGRSHNTSLCVLETHRQLNSLLKVFFKKKKNVALRRYY